MNEWIKLIINMNPKFSIHEHLIDNIVIDLLSSRNFVNIKGIKRNVIQQ